MKIFKCRLRFISKFGLGLSSLTICFIRLNFWFFFRFLIVRIFFKGWWSFCVFFLLSFEHSLFYYLLDLISPNLCLVLVLRLLIFFCEAFLSLILYLFFTCYQHLNFLLHLSFNFQFLILSLLIIFVHIWQLNILQRFLLLILVF